MFLIVLSHASVTPRGRGYHFNSGHLGPGIVSLGLVTEKDPSMELPDCRWDRLFFYLEN